EDALGRKWQLATIQVDLTMLPERMQCEYIDTDGKAKRPVVIHRAIFGSYERFVAILTEHFAGAFPTWLAPVQARVLPISEKHAEHGRKVFAAPRASAPSSTIATRSWAIASGTLRFARCRTCWSWVSARPRTAPPACAAARVKTWARCRWSASWPSSSPRSEVVPPPSPWVTPAEPAPHPKERAIQSKDIRINEGIRVREVRVVSAEGEQLGILPIAQALELARQREMDLVEVAAEAQPPVCRIMDFGKYKYMQARRQKDARKKQTIIQVKEVKLGPKTDTHDFDFKAKHVRRFLEEGNKAKVTVRFKGREMAHTELGWKMLNKMVEGMSDIAVIENHPRMEGRMLSMILSPKPH